MTGMMPAGGIFTNLPVPLPLVARNQRSKGPHILGRTQNAPGNTTIFLSTAGIVAIHVAAGLRQEHVYK